MIPMKWRFWRRSDLEEAGVRAIGDAKYEAWRNRHELRRRLGVRPEPSDFLSGYENTGEISNSLKELWAAIDALEKRTRPT